MRRNFSQAVWARVIALAGTRTEETLFQAKAFRDEVHLIAHSLQFVAGDCEAQRIKRALVDLKVIYSTVHRSTGSDVFVREDGAAKPSLKSDSFTLTANYVSR